MTLLPYCFVNVVVDNGEVKIVAVRLQFSLVSICEHNCKLMRAGIDSRHPKKYLYLKMISGQL